MFAVFLITSCGKFNVIDETIEDENNDSIHFEIIPRDTITVDINVYPDA